MTNPIIIVHPLSSGKALAPAFKARGIPAIAITLGLVAWQGFGVEMNKEDFLEIIPEQSNLIEKLKPYKPLAVIPGCEEGVPLADKLAHALTPAYANDIKKSSNRLHKALMQEALNEARLPAIKTIHTSSEKAVEDWLKKHNLEKQALIVKPPVSAGSDKVFHIPPMGDWKKPFNRVLTEPTKTSGQRSETVVIQEQVFGTEFAVGTVSCDGKHYLSHLIQYHKGISDYQKTVYDYVEFIPYDPTTHRELIAYTFKALDALGIRYGAAHNEIMLTEKGPRLIETGARLCGGPVVEFSRRATGSSQADKLIEIYLDGDVSSKEYKLQETVIPVFLKSPAEGAISNVEALQKIYELPTFFNEHLWFNEGDEVPKTVDYLTSIGIIGLAGTRDEIMQDYAKIREMESQLRVS